MIYTPHTKRALKLAYAAHHGQTDKSGLPYIHHVLHVAEQMPDEITTVAALLHDIVEDTDVTLEQLRDFPPESVEIVRRLTHDPSVPYPDYVRALRDNRGAVAVKLADLAHNSDLSRLDQVDAAARARAEKYQRAIRILRTTEVVAALIWQDNRFLICQRPADKARGLLWEFVGGKVEPGETMQQALVRECQEELGITISVGTPFTEVTHLYPDLTVHLTLFHAEISEGTPQLLEHHAMRWISPEETDSYDFCPADVDILARIRQQYR